MRRKEPVGKKKRRMRMGRMRHRGRGRKKEREREDQGEEMKTNHSRSDSATLQKKSIILPAAFSTLCISWSFKMLNHLKANHRMSTSASGFANLADCAIHGLTGSVLKARKPGNVDVSFKT